MLKIEGINDEIIDVVVGEDVKYRFWGCCIGNQNAQGLNDLCVEFGNCVSVST